MAKLTGGRKLKDRRKKINGKKGKISIKNITKAGAEILYDWNIK